MLLIGLTGGIAAGKSTASNWLRAAGAQVIDADLIAREVVEPGSPGLAAIRDHFGPGVIKEDGSLDRAALGGIVFADEQARKALEQITHPLIGRRTEECIAAAPVDGITVYDMPLLVEGGLTARYHLVMVVSAPQQIRVDRMVRDRGMTAEAARARMAAQATDQARRAAADIWLENDDSPRELEERLATVWRERLAPFNENLLSGRPAEHPKESPDQQAVVRQRARIQHHFAPFVEGHGSSLSVNVEGRTRWQLQVAGSAEPDALGRAARSAGFVPVSATGEFVSADPALGGVLVIRRNRS
jgi:dephospho-CoA kinase